MSNLSIGDEVIVETSIVGTGQVRGKLVSISPCKVRTDEFTIKVLPDHVIKSIEKDQDEGESWVYEYGVGFINAEEQRIR